MSKDKNIPLNKERFLQQYVLNRALVVPKTLEGIGSLKEAILIYKNIQEELKKDND